MGFRIFPYYVESGSSWTILTWRCGLDFTILQGTKVLKDHEIRRSFNVTAQGNPPRHTSPRISKYTGNLVSPKWVDIEPGSVYLPLAPREKFSKSKRQFRNVVLCQGQHFQRPVYITLLANGRNGLQAAL